MKKKKIGLIIGIVIAILLFFGTILGAGVAFVVYNVMNATYVPQVVYEFDENEPLTTEQLELVLNEMLEKKNVFNQSQISLDRYSGDYELLDNVYLYIESNNGLFTKLLLHYDLDKVSYMDMLYTSILEHTFIYTITYNDTSKSYVIIEEIGEIIDSWDSLEKTMETDFYIIKYRYDENENDLAMMIELKE